MTHREGPRPLEIHKEETGNQRLRKMFEERKDELIFEELKQYVEDPDSLKVFFRKKSEDWYVILITDGSTGTLDSGFEFDSFDVYYFSEIISISEGRFYRPLIYMSIKELTPEILYVHGFEIDRGLRGGKVTPFFYQRLEAIARGKDYRFLVGYQDNKKLAKVYLQMGRYFFEEVKPEFQKEFQSAIKQGPHLKGDRFTTIKFLDKSDVERYVKPDCLHKSIDERIEYNKEMRS